MGNNWYSNTGPSDYRCLALSPGLLFSIGEESVLPPGFDLTLF
jgi:hypothetical protein